MFVNTGETIPEFNLPSWEFIPQSWDVDLGTVPDEVRVNEMVYSKLVEDDTVIYTDIPLTGPYDKGQPISMDVIFDTESGNAGDVNWIVDYMVTEHGTAASGTFTNNRTVQTRTVGNKLEKLTLGSIIPAQSGLTTSATLTLRFGRLGADAADTLSDSLLILSTKLYQGSAG